MQCGSSELHQSCRVETTNFVDYLNSGSAQRAVFFPFDADLHNKRNPTHGSGGMVQIRPTRPAFEDF